MDKVNQDGVENVQPWSENPQVENPLSTLREYVVPPTRIQSVIRRLTIQANKFELILIMIQLV